MSGRSRMKPRATSAIDARPTAGGPSFTLSEPFSAKNAATLSGFWLHHAEAYRFANVVILARSFTRVSLGMALVNLDEAFAYHYARAPDPRRSNGAVRLFGTSQ